MCQGQTLPPKHLPEQSPAPSHDIPLMPTWRGSLSTPCGTARSHITDGVGKRRFNYGKNTRTTKTSGQSPMVPCPHIYEKATTSPCRTSSEDTESSGWVIPLIQNILICSLLQTFLGVENYLIKSCHHYLRPKVWFTFIILSPREVYFTLGFVLPLIEAGPSKQKRKHA